MKKIILTILTFLILATVAKASEIEESFDVDNQIISSIESELSDFEASLPDYVKEFLPKEIFEGDFTPLINGEINEMSFIDYIVTYLFSYLPTVLKSFAWLLVLIILISIFNTIKTSFANDGLKNAFSFCSVLCISITVFSSVDVIIDICIKYMSVLCSSMNTFAPVMSAMYIMNGAITSAAVANASMMLFLAIVENFLLIVLAPIVKICSCFAIVSSISGGVDLNGISKLIKNTFTGVCVLLMSIFSFVMSFQGVIGQELDSVSMRTAKFAIGNFIPIVGGFLSESLKTISAGLSLIKSSCGVIAIIVIIIITLPVIISLLLYRLSFNISGAICKALGNDAEERVIGEASSICAFGIAIVGLVSVVFVYAITIFIKSSVV